MTTAPVEQTEQKSPFRKALEIMLEGTDISPEEFDSRLQSHVSDCYFDDDAAAIQFLEKAHRADLDQVTFIEVSMALYGTQ